MCVSICVYILTVYIYTYLHTHYYCLHANKATCRITYGKVNCNSINTLWGQFYILQSKFRKGIPQTQHTYKGTHIGGEKEMKKDEKREERESSTIISLFINLGKILFVSSTSSLLPSSSLQQAASTPVFPRHCAN